MGEKTQTTEVTYEDELDMKSIIDEFSKVTANYCLRPTEKGYQAPKVYEEKTNSLGVPLM